MRTFTDLHGRGEPPLSSWRKPHPGEPAHGFVTALAWEAGRSSLATLLNAHGLNGRDIQPAECLEFALSFPIGDKEALAHATAIVGPTTVTLMGQVVRRGQWTVGRRRFCPACLAEKPYHRAWWDLLAFRRCPDHDIDIAEDDGAGRPVPWWSPSFSHAPTGRALARFGIPRRTTPRPGLEAYVLGRLGILPPTPVALLDGLPTLGTALDAVRFVGRVAIGGTRRSAPVVDATRGFAAGTVDRAGYDLLSAGEAGLVRKLDEIAHANAPTSVGWGKKALFTWVPAALCTEENVLNVPFLSGALERVAIAHGQFSKATLASWRVGAGGWTTAEAIGRELGLSRARVRRISEALGIHGRRSRSDQERFRVFAPDEAALVRTTVAALVDRREAAALLGLEPDAFGSLVAGGTVKPFTAIGNGPGRDRFRPADLRAFEAEILGEAALTDGPAEGSVRFAAIRRTCKTDPAAVLARARAGRSPLARVGPRLGDLLVPPVQRVSDTAAARAALRTLPGVGRYEAATRLGCAVEVVDALIGAGMLAQISHGAAWRRVDRGSLDALTREWAPVAIYHDVVGTDRTGSPVPALRARGVHMRVLARRDGAKAWLVDRRSARAVLGLATDPDDPAAGGRCALEAAVLRIVADRGALKLIGRTNGLLLTTAKGDASLRVRTGTDLAEVVVSLIRAGGWRSRTDALAAKLGGDPRLGRRAVARVPGPEGGGAIFACVVRMPVRPRADVAAAADRVLAALEAILIVVGGGHAAQGGGGRRPASTPAGCGPAATLGRNAHG